MASESIMGSRRKKFKGTIRRRLQSRIQNGDITYLDLMYTKVTLFQTIWRLLSNSGLLGRLRDWQAANIFQANWKLDDLKFSPEVRNEASKTKRKKFLEKILEKDNY